MLTRMNQIHRKLASSTVQRWISFTVSPLSRSVSGMSHNDQWQLMFEKLKEQVGTTGENMRSGDQQLSRWIDAQKVLFRNRKKGEPTTLNDDRIEKLDELGFNWGSITNVSWDDYYKELKFFYDDSGHSHVPCGSSLATWLERQRHQYRLHLDGKPSSLTEQRLQLLQEVEMVGNIQLKIWDQYYEELKAYSETHGHTNLHSVKESALGRWVHSQRRQYKKRQNGKPSNMNDERTVRLNELEFVWDAHEAIWHERFKELCEYRDHYKDTLVPSKWSQNRELANWVDTQRQQYKNLINNRLDSPLINDKRRALLEDIDFTWDVFDAAWERKLADLTLFVEVNGPGVTPTFAQDSTLFLWLRAQRLQYRKLKKGKKVVLTDERIAKLGRLGIRLDGMQPSKGSD